jgi:hypothetical protein
MIRGVWQLQRLTLVHCKSGGSSRGARDFIETRLPQFAAAHPQLKLETKVRGNRHPFVQAEYRQRSDSHTHSLQQYCRPACPLSVIRPSSALVFSFSVNGVVKELDVKNETAAAIQAVCESLRKQTGRHVKRKWSH